MSVQAERPTLEGFDPLSDEFLTDPFPTWARAHAEHPVFYYPGMDFWVITKFDDVLAAVTDHTTFSSRAVGVVPPPPELRDSVPGDFFDHSLVSVDPPEHTVARKPSNSGFTRPRVAAMEAKIRAIAERLIDGFINDGTCDLMQDYCYQLSLRTITSLLGLDDSEEQLARYRQWTEDMFSLMTPMAKDSGENPLTTRPMADEDRRRHWENIGEAASYFQELIDARRAEPTDDLLSLLVHTQADGKPAMSDGEIITHIQELIAAGNDTTANLIGSFVYYLSQQPEDFAELKAHPELMPNAVEEGLRRRGSSVGMFRITTRDVVVSGVDIPQGSLVFLSFQAAGHDPEHFPDPRRVDIHRENAKEHVAFGRGRHFCLGAPLARLEAKIGLEVLFRRIPDLAVPDQELRFAPVMTVSMLTSLRVRW